MALKITHSCEWCNKVEECISTNLPKDWIPDDVPDPKNFGVIDGSFCKTECKVLYDKHRLDALESATNHYANEFYSYMNKMKAMENEVS